MIRQIKSLLAGSLTILYSYYKKRGFIMSIFAKMAGYFGEFALDAFLFKNIPKIWNFLKGSYGKLPPEYQQKLKDRVEKILGFSLKDAKRDVTDEIIYGVAVAELKNSTKEAEIDAFERKLRCGDGGKNKEKAEAFVLFIAKIVMQFLQEIKETKAPKKGETGPVTSKTINDISKGLEFAVNFLEALLKNTGTDDEATFNARVAFLEGKNVFSLIPPEKKPSKAEQLAKDFTKKTGEKISQTAKNADDAIKTFEDNARARYEASKARRKK